MRKVLSMMLLAVGIILGNQLTEISKVSAADVYVYSESGVEYYVGGSRTMQPGCFASFVKGVSGGKVVKQLFFFFQKSQKGWLYQIQDQTSGMRGSYVLEQGYLSNSGKAKAVYDVTKAYFL